MRLQSLSFEVFIGALDLSPYVVSISDDGEQGFDIELNQNLPEEYQQYLDHLSANYHTSHYIAIYGIRRPCFSYLFHLEYRPLNADIHAYGKPILNRDPYTSQGVWFLRGRYPDAAPF